MVGGSAGSKMGPLKALLMISLLVGYIGAEMEKDFEFSDDEDMLNDGPSGEGSGEIANVTSEPTVDVTYPTGVPALYRVVINVTSEAYTDEIAAAGRDIGSLAITLQLQEAIQQLFNMLPGTIRVRIVDLQPGSLMVTFDFDTDGQQSEEEILALLNKVLNQGNLNGYRVSDEGFEFKKIRDMGTTCSLKVGREPTALPEQGNLWANLMINNQFPCNGFIVGWRYHRAAYNGTTIIGVFRQVSETEYVLIAKTELPSENNIGVYTTKPDTPILVQKGDFIGIFHPQNSRGSIIPFTKAGPESELFQNYYTNLYESDLVQEQPFKLTDFVYSENKANYALQAQMSYENVPVIAVQPKPVACESDQWRCRNGECVPAGYRCDSQTDCYDGSDEENCPTPACPSGEFQCRDGRQCLPQEFVCNFVNDCGDASDELNCGPAPVVIISFRQGTQPSSFEVSWLRPQQGGSAIRSYIIMYRKVLVRSETTLDGDYIIQSPLESFTDVTIDNPNQDKYTLTGLDSGSYYEVEMRARNSIGESEPRAFVFKTASAGCVPGEWQCADGGCIPLESWCDAFPDCSDDSDEDGCEDTFRCNEGQVFCKLTDGSEVCRDEAVGCVVCRETQFQCLDNRKCIEFSMLCDGQVDCYDNSDESNCECETGEFQCVVGRQCISDGRRCDGVTDCDDGSDEDNCPCPTGTFQCLNTGTRNQCVTEALVCDGANDCTDGSDELNCPTTPAPGCPAGLWRCADGACIPNRMRCDRVPQCEDSSDEFDCPGCRADQFTCNDGNCIEGRMRCDRIRHCEDSSDELDCPGCRADQYTCDDGNCIEDRMRCDGVPQCEDSSDEDGCPCREGMFQCRDGNCVEGNMKCDGVPQCEDATDEEDCPVSSCPESDFQCLNTILGNKIECIDKRLRCDGDTDCSDGSDEVNCPGCRRDQFTCESDGQCVSSSAKCDGNIDCADLSDELDCVCRENQFQCGDGICIDLSRRCDRRLDCRDRSDELACPCQDGEFQCLNGNCIPESSRCDRRQDCGDGSDENSCPCRNDEFTCSSGECVPQSRRCDNRVDCLDRSDESNCPRESRCPDGYYECGTGHCLGVSRRCDGRSDCPDGSDERNCSLQCADDEFECVADNKCLTADQICNRVYDCSDRRDESNCARCNENEFQCESDRSCISATGRCNRIKECSDGSDEMNCPPVPAISIEVSPRNLRIRAGAEAIIFCIGSGLPQNARLEWVRRGGELPMQSAVEAGKLMIPVAKPMDSGDYVCRVVGVPGIYEELARLDVVDISVGPQENTTDTGKCGRDEAVCQNGQCIRREYRCDGEADCADGSDEPPDCFNNLCEPNEFQCPSGQCVMKIWRCDGENDCDDGFDESNCAAKDPNEDCGYDEFQCLSGDQCIPLAYQCDQEIDCLDRSDEIGCSPPVITLPPVAEIEVELGSTFTIICEAVGVPTPLIVWRLNWGNIPVGERVTTTSSEGRGVLTIADVRYEDGGAYTCEAINNRGSIFAIPDALVIVRLDDNIPITTEELPIQTNRIVSIGGAPDIQLHPERESVLINHPGNCPHDIQVTQSGSTLSAICTGTEQRIDIAYIGSQTVNVEIAKKVVIIERRGDIIPDSEPLTDATLILLGGLPDEVRGGVKEVEIISGFSADSIEEKVFDLHGQTRHKGRTEKQIVYVGLGQKCDGNLMLKEIQGGKELQCLLNVSKNVVKTEILVHGNSGTKIQTNENSIEKDIGLRTNVVIEVESRPLNDAEIIEPNLNVTVTHVDEPHLNDQADVNNVNQNNIQKGIVDEGRLNGNSTTTSGTDNIHSGIAFHDDFDEITGNIFEILNAGHVDISTDSKYIELGMGSPCLTSLEVYVVGSHIICSCQGQNTTITYTGSTEADFQFVREIVLLSGGRSWSKYQKEDFVIIYMGAFPAQLRNKAPEIISVNGVRSEQDFSEHVEDGNVTDIYRNTGPSRHHRNQRQIILISVNKICNHRLQSLRSGGKDLVKCSPAKHQPYFIQDDPDVLNTKIAELEEPVMKIHGAYDVNVNTTENIVDLEFNWNCLNDSYILASIGHKFSLNCREGTEFINFTYMGQIPTDVYISRLVLREFIADDSIGSRNNKVILSIGNQVNSKFERKRMVKLISNVNASSVNYNNEIVKFIGQSGSFYDKMRSIIEIGLTGDCNGTFNVKHTPGGHILYCGEKGYNESKVGYNENNDGGTPVKKMGVEKNITSTLTDKHFDVYKNVKDDLPNFDDLASKNMSNGITDATDIDYERTTTDIDMPRRRSDVSIEEHIVEKQDNELPANLPTLDDSQNKIKPEIIEIDILRERNKGNIDKKRKFMKESVVVLEVEKHATIKVEATSSIPIFVVTTPSLQYGLPFENIPRPTVESVFSINKGLPTPENKVTNHDLTTQSLTFTMPRVHTMEPKIITERESSLDNGIVQEEVVVVPESSGVGDFDDNDEVEREPERESVVFSGVSDKRQKEIVIITGNPDNRQEGRTDIIDTIDNNLDHEELFPESSGSGAFGDNSEVRESDHETLVFSGRKSPNERKQVVIVTGNTGMNGEENITTVSDGVDSESIYIDSNEDDILHQRVNVEMEESLEEQSSGETPTIIKENEDLNHYDVTHLIDRTQENIVSGNDTEKDVNIDRNVKERSELYHESSGPLLDVLKGNRSVTNSGHVTGEQHKAIRNNGMSETVVISGHSPAKPERSMGISASPAEPENGMGISETFSVKASSLNKTTTDVRMTTENIIFNELELLTPKLSIDTPEKILDSDLEIVTPTVKNMVQKQRSLTINRNINQVMINQTEPSLDVDFNDKCQDDFKVTRSLGRVSVTCVKSMVTLEVGVFGKTDTDSSIDIRTTTILEEVPEKKEDVLRIYLAGVRQWQDTLSDTVRLEENSTLFINYSKPDDLTGEKDKHIVQVVEINIRQDCKSGSIEKYIDSDGTVLYCSRRSDILPDEYNVISPSTDMSVNLDLNATKSANEALSPDIVTLKNNESKTQYIDVKGVTESNAYHLFEGAYVTSKPDRNIKPIVQTENVHGIEHSYSEGSADKIEVVQTKSNAQFSELDNKPKEVVIQASDLELHVTDGIDVIGTKVSSTTEGMPHRRGDIEIEDFQNDIDESSRSNRDEIKSHKSFPTLSGSRSTIRKEHSRSYASEQGFRENTRNINKPPPVTLTGGHKSHRSELPESMHKSFRHEIPTSKGSVISSFNGIGLIDMELNKSVDLKIGKDCKGSIEAVEVDDGVVIKCKFGTEVFHLHLPGFIKGQETHKDWTRHGYVNESPYSNDSYGTYIVKDETVTVPNKHNSNKFLTIRHVYLATRKRYMNSLKSRRDLASRQTQNLQDTIIMYDKLYKMKSHLKASEIDSGLDREWVKHGKEYELNVRNKRSSRDRTVINKHGRGSPRNRRTFKSLKGVLRDINGFNKYSNGNQPIKKMSYVHQDMSGSRKGPRYVGSENGQRHIGSENGHKQFGSRQGQSHVYDASKTNSRYIAPIHGYHKGIDGHVAKYDQRNHVKSRIASSKDKHYLYEIQRMDNGLENRKSFSMPGNKLFGSGQIEKQNNDHIPIETKTLTNKILMALSTREDGRNSLQNDLHSVTNQNKRLHTVLNSKTHGKHSSAYNKHVVTSVDTTQQGTIHGIDREKYNIFRHTFHPLGSHGTRNSRKRYTLGTLHRGKYHNGNLRNRNEKSVVLNDHKMLRLNGHRTDPNVVDEINTNILFGTIQDSDTGFNNHMTVHHSHGTTRGQRGPCEPPFFNHGATSSDECVRCFCFGQSVQCFSSDLQVSNIGLANAVTLVRKDREEVIADSVVNFKANTREYQVLDFSRTLNSGSYYWSLPVEFMGERLNSYGGELKYTIYYDTEIRRPVPTNYADVVISGNGITLYYRARTQPNAGVPTSVSVPLIESSWERYDGTIRGDTPITQYASREEFMTVLQNLDSIHVKANYDNRQSTVRIGGVFMSTAVDYPTEFGQAFLVENCQCPTGYTGLSCQTCAAGFTRIQSGGFLGQCIPCNCNGHSNDCDSITGECLYCQHNTYGAQCQICSDGYYGNARGGTPEDCQACPCPLTEPANQFSRTCFLDSDREVTCGNCPDGYEGRRCEKCSDGYRGDPMTPGSSCIKYDIEEICDSRGSLSVNPDIRTRQCSCKENVAGQRCDSCKQNTFYLTNNYNLGCIQCFCMGVSKSCQSTYWNRAQTGISFTQDEAGVTVTDSQGRPIEGQRLQINANSREVVYRIPQDSDLVYWSLPARFLGDKVTAYGGSLRFTLRYSSRQGPAVDSREPFVKLTGNEITLIYRQSQQADRPNRPQSFNIVMYEQNWYRADGQPATREHLLMALADLDSILIRASFEEQQGDAGLRDVTMDVAENRRTRQDRAYAVEQCVCPVGYRGLSCEDCDTGYTRSGGGLYLGLCEPCNCNGHSNECDPETGACRNCQHNTAGDYCDQCAVGYYGDATRGTRNDCQKCPCPLTESPNQFSPTCELAEDGQVTCTSCPAGHTGRRCETCVAGYTGNPMKPGGFCEFGPVSECDCDTRGTVPNIQCDKDNKQCQCKPYTQGLRCARCREGYFYLEANNPQGCLTCYCSGITNQCTSSSYFRDALRPVFSNDGNHNFVLMNRRMNNIISDGFVVDVSRNQVTFNAFEGVQRERESLFFQLPAKFRGDRVTSYGGYLRFTLEFTAKPEGRMSRDVDLEIISSGQALRLYNLFNPALREGKTQTYEILLRESSFVDLRSNTGPTRATFMTILSNIEGILIRATYHTAMSTVTLRDVSMDTAIPTATDLGGAPMVEDCRCPEGYTGLSCERCAQGYLRVSDGRGGLGRCVRCNCNGHATSCDPETGRCLDCQGNTEGDRCEICSAGYYGDATSGTPTDCRKCPCPLTVPSNQFSRTCYLAEDNKVTCDRCPSGYTGRQCEVCADGYTGNPSQPGDACRKVDLGERPEVAVSPVRVEEPLGSTAVFQCNVGGPGPFRVVWSRLDSRQLPSRASTSPRYALTIRDLRSEDSGRYVCTASNNFGVSSGYVTLQVNTGPSPIQVRIDTPRLEIDEGRTARIVCSAVSTSGEMTYILSWSKQGSQMPAKVIDQNGVLIIPNVQKSDEGSYICMGSDMFTMDEEIAVLVITDNEQAPSVRIDPRYQTVDEGSPVMFTCIATGSPSPKIEWYRGGNREMNPEATITSDGVFRIPRVTEGDESDYYCKATNDLGVTEVRTILYVKRVQRAEITVIVRRTSVIVIAGTTARLECYTDDTTGRVTVFWSRQNGLPRGSNQENGVLTIPDVQRSYGGTYICTATDTDNGRTNQATTTLEVNVETPSEVPTVSVEPEKLTIPMGTTGSLRCVATGTPTPTVKWIKSREQLAPNHQVTGNTLRITQATMEDRGIYVCRAENSAGMNQDWAVVEVERRMRPKIDIYPNVTQTVVVGGRALFQCRVMDGDPPPKVKWTRVGGLGLTDNTEVMDNGVIMFEDVSQSEMGSYICTATNDMGTITATVTLIVQGPPSITLQPSQVVYALIGERVTLECTAAGDPTPQVYWVEPKPARRGDLPPDVDRAYPASEGSAVLNIASVDREDQGNYRCVATNDGGRVEENVQVIVRERDGDGSGRTAGVRISGPSTLSVSTGQSVELVCTAEAIQGASIRWTRREGALPPGHSVKNGILTIPQFRAEYAGEYICSTIVPAGRFQTSVFIIVTVAPRLTISPQRVTARAGETIMLRCAASGSGPFDIEWMKVDGQMNPRASERDGVLEIRQATAADAGRYRCVVRSQAGTTDGYAIVTLDVPPQVTVSNRDVKVSPGATAELRCSVSGSPAPVVRWEKEIGDMPAQHRIQNGILTIYNAQSEDSGRYICTATSSSGTARDYGILIVDVGVSVTNGGIVGRDTQIVNVGDRVSMECVVTGTPLPTITWSREDGDLPKDAIVGDGILILEQAKIEDAGTYTCLVVNEAGSITRQVTLYVRAQPFVSAPSATTAALGDRASLSCEATGYPSPDITWMRKDGEMPDDYTIVDGNLMIMRVKPDDAGTYICQAQNQYGKTETPVDLAVGDLVPYFAQDPQSYMTFKALNDVYLDFDILLSLRPESSEGMVLYNGQFEDGGGDFVCFGLNEGYPEFRFDVGSGPAIIRGNQTLSLNEWHTIKLKRNRKKGEMVVNDQSRYTGESPGFFTGLDLTQNMYLGSVPDYNNIPQAAGFKEGFVGSISEVKLKGIDMNIGAEALEIVGIEPYNTCRRNPCANGGTCMPANTRYGFMCGCKRGFTGERCQEVGMRCHQGACGQGRCYDLEDGSGFSCICPLGKSGAGCNLDITIITPFFNRTSFISYPPAENALFSLNLYVEFKPYSLSDGIILYEGNSRDGTGDYMALIQKDGYLEFRFDTGSGPAIIRSEYPLRLNEWTRVTATRTNRAGTLVVNNDEPITGASPGNTVGLNLKLPMYLGGPDPTYPVASSVGVTNGFIGCVAELQVNDNKIDLLKDAIESANVVDCGERRLCERQPCGNKATCEDLPGPDYRCICQPTHTGKNCEVEINLCLTNSPCQNGAPCSITNAGYRCDCPLGFMGDNCETVVDIQTKMGFIGESFVEFSKNLLPHNNTQERQTVSLVITTTSANGLILWQGEQGGRPLRGGDHFAIGLKEGLVEFRYEMGSGPAVITSPVRVDDGKPHRIDIEKFGRTGSLSIDSAKSMFAESQGFLMMLNAGGNIYVGGVSLIGPMTENKYSENFRGCISDIVINNKGPLKPSDALSGFNIEPCGQ